MKKLLILIGFCLITLLLQVVLAPWMTVRDIKPDFVLILIMFVAIMYGRVTGQLFGFGFGLLVDIIGIGSFFGLSALSKTIAGFLAGYLKGRRFRLNSFTFYTLSCLIVFVHYAIFFLINYHSADYSTRFLIIRYILPETVYTSVIFILSDYIFSIDNE